MMKKTIQQKRFESFKEDVLNRATSKGLSSGTLQEIKESASIKDLEDVIDFADLPLSDDKTFDYKFVVKYEKEYEELGYKYNKSASSGKIIVYNKKIYAYGITLVIAYGKSKVIAYDNSRVAAYNNTTVTAAEHCIVMAYDNSIVKATEISEIHARHNAIVTAKGSNRVYAYDNTTIHLSGFSSVLAYNHSCIYASCYSNIEAHDSSIVKATGFSKVESHTDSEIEASGHALISTVHKNIKCKLSDFAILINRKKNSIEYARPSMNVKRQVL